MHSPTSHDIACHFCISHVAGASAPGSRLNNMLTSMYHGRPLTQMAKSQLLQWNLSSLHQLACGVITYEAYIAALDPALVARERESQISAAEDLARRAEAFAGYRRSRAQTRGAGTERTMPNRKTVARADQAIPRKSTVAVAAIDHRAERERRKRERDAEQAEFVARFTEQAQLNREAAAALCRARLNELGRMPGPEEIARHFRMEQVPNALQRPLANILEVLYRGQPVAIAYLNYLEEGLRELYRLAIGQVSYPSYLAELQARFDKQVREHEAAEAERIAAEAARAARLAAQREAEAARLARESDPAYILRRKYGVAEIEQPHLQRMMDILQHIDGGNRMGQVDFVWLTTEAKGFFSQKLRQAYHLREAEFCAGEYRRTQDPWNAVNASGHYRKCDGQHAALELLDSVPDARLKQPKLKSALLTTRGGVLRDLGRRREAMQLGEQAHALQSRNFRPCTLLGALHMESGNFAEGQEWYAKAEERGASQQSIDSELRSIFQRASEEERKKLRAFLLADDPVRYRWVDGKKSRSA